MHTVVMSNRLSGVRKAPFFSSLRENESWEGKCVSSNDGKVKLEKYGLVLEFVRAKRNNICDNLEASFNGF